MIIDVKLFALAKDLVGASSVQVEIPPGATIADLRSVLREQHPALERLIDQVLFAADTEYATDDLVIDEDVEIACIPPVSGG